MSSYVQKILAHAVGCYCYYGRGSNPSSAMMALLCDLVKFILLLWAQLPYL